MTPGLSIFVCSALKIPRQDSRLHEYLKYSRKVASYHLEKKEFSYDGTHLQSEYSCRLKWERGCFSFAIPFAHNTFRDVISISVRSSGLSIERVVTQSMASGESFFWRIHGSHCVTGECMVCYLHQICKICGNWLSRLMRVEESSCGWEQAPTARANWWTSSCFQAMLTITQTPCEFVNGKGTKAMCLQWKSKVSQDKCVTHWVKRSVTQAK